jgi:hypothetical protein
MVSMPMQDNDITNAKKIAAAAQQSISGLEAFLPVLAQRIRQTPQVSL